MGGKDLTLGVSVRFFMDYYPLTRFEPGERVPVIPSDQQAAARVAGFSRVWTNPDKQELA